MINIDTAKKLIDSGLSIIPIRADGSKAPACSSWKEFQNEPAGTDHLNSWFASGKNGMAIITGRVSGNLEVLDFDDPDTACAWRDVVDDHGLTDLVESLPVQVTPGDGYHLIYRIAGTVPGNQKLAQRRDPQGKLEVLIETRGEGGYVIATGSPSACHPTGKPYELVRGDLLDIPVITEAERTMLIGIARLFDESQKSGNWNHQPGPGKPGTDFNAKATWERVLAPHGWHRINETNGVVQWRRPGKRGPGISATTNFRGNDLLHVFSSNATPLEPEKAYDKFAAYTFLNHGGDFKRAAQQLAKEGYGAKQSSNRSQNSQDSQSEQANNNGGEWPELKPLQRELPPPQPYPIKEMGLILGDAAYEMHRIIQAPTAICGQGVLAAAALAAQGHANVCIDGRTMPLSEFFVTVGLSGERKSAVDEQALWAQRKHQDKLLEEFESLHPDYERNADVWKNAREAILRSRKGTVSTKKAALEELGEAPVPPILPICLADDPTYEGLVKLMMVGQPSLGIFSDEGGRFIGGHGMNNDNQIKTAAGLCGLWDGKAISRVRAGDGAVLLHGRRVSLHLMVQPTIAALWLSNKQLIDQGLLSRCLVSWPETTAGTRLYREEDLAETEAIIRLRHGLLSVLRMPLPLVDGKLNELRPTKLLLSEDAKRVWIAFHDDTERRLGPGGELSLVRSLASKAPEHAARLAGILAFIDNPESVVISVDYIHAAIRLIQHYLDEALRLFNAGVMDPELANAQSLLDWLLKKAKSVISLVEIYRYGPQGIRDAKTARGLLELLQDHGWVRPSLIPVEFEGVLRKETWDLRLDS